MCLKILYHTQIHRELKVFLIPCKQLNLSSSRLQGANPTNSKDNKGYNDFMNQPGQRCFF